MPGTVAVVVKGYPRLSETFIAQEIRGLEERGLRLRIVSLRHPTDRHLHPVHDEIEAPVRYLPEYLYQEPMRVLRAWRAVRRRPQWRTLRRTWFRDLLRDRTPNRIRRLGQAMVLAHEMPADVTHIHVHFLHTPASVARYAALLTGLPWTASAHAKDIWTSPDWEKREKLASCRWLVTCSAYARDHLAALAPDPDRVELVYHGLDGARFPPAPGRRPLRTGSERSDPIRILSVGRAVEKKGHDVLIDALARLPAGVHWRLVHVGGGPLRDALRRRAETLGIGGRIDWKGSLPQGDVIAEYRAADLFVLACRVGRDGDRDGLPNVLMEAQSQGLACIATNVSAVPELIVDGETGVLVPPEDPAALADAIAALAAAPERRLFLGRSGETRVRTAFSFAAGIDRLARKLGAPGADSGRNAA
jgi:glycosyltransferase involved in cell wall biosynthesis